MSKGKKRRQGKFRQDLFLLWNGACSVSGCDLHQFLRASHIKRWAESNVATSHSTAKYFPAGPFELRRSASSLVYGRSISRTLIAMKILL